MLSRAHILDCWKHLAGTGKGFCLRFSWLESLKLWRPVLLDRIYFDEITWVAVAKKAITLPFLDALSLVDFELICATLLSLLEFNVELGDLSHRNILVYLESLDFWSEICGSGRVLVFLVKQERFNNLILMLSTIALWHSLLRLLPSLELLLFHSLKLWFWLI